MQDITDKIAVKLFMGCQITFEIRMHLNQSKIWKQVHALPQDSAMDLIEIHYRDHDYIGRFVSYEKVTLKQVREHENLIRDTLQLYCPEYNVESLHICIFPQLFIA